MRESSQTLLYSNLGEDKTASMTYKRHYNECFPQSSSGPEIKLSADGANSKVSIEAIDFNKAFMHDRKSLHENVSIELNEPPQKRKCNDLENDSC